MNPLATVLIVILIQQAVGQVTPLSFSEWSDGYGLTPEERTAEAIPNEDGVPNSIKYALGVPPLDQVPSILRPQAVVSGNIGNKYLTYGMDRDPASIEAVLTASLSSDLSDWAEDLDQINIWENSTDRFEVGVPVLADGPVFLRFAVNILDSNIPWAAPANTLVYNFTGSSLAPSRGSMPGIWFSSLSHANLLDWGFSSSQASSGYASASGGINLYASQLVPAETASEDAPYISLNLAPAVDAVVSIDSVSFGARTLVYPTVDPGPGPTRYELRTSIDGFASPVASGDFITMAGSSNYWYDYAHDNLDVTGGPGEKVEVRLYFLGATAGIRAGAFRIDDFAISPKDTSLQAQDTFYVSSAGNDSWSGALPEANPEGTDGPFATITRARDAIRQRHVNGMPSGPVTVFIRGGTYRIENPITFTPLDSGSNLTPITYKAYADETPVISGGRPLTGWTESAPGKYETLVSEATGRSWIFRQLFVDGQRMTLARSPNEEYFRMAGPADPELFPPETAHEIQYYDAHFYRYHQGQLKAWENISDVNIVAFYSWHAGIIPLTWVDEASRTFHTNGSMRNAYGGKLGEEMRFYVENVPDALDAVEEWYLDRDSGNLSYLNQPGLDLASLEAVAPVAEQLLILDGDPLQEEWVEHLSFEGLTLEHTAFNLPEEGISDTQGSVYVAGGAVEILGARDINFIGNEIRHTGGHALWVREGSYNVNIERNHLHDLGGGGVYIGNRDTFTRSGDTFTPPPEGITAFVTVENNYLHDMGFIHRQAHGIWIGQSSDNIVRHNEISHVDYSAVSLGWSWGFSPSECNRNLVEYNHIHSVSRNVFADCGGIYTLGEQLGTVIRYNHIHDVWGHREYQGKGIYPDEGSSGILYSHNIVHGTSGAVFGVNYGSNLTVRNNFFAFNASGGAIERGRNDGGRSLDLVFEKNIVLIDHPRPFESFGTLASLSDNLYWNRNGSIRFQGGADLAEWKAASGLDASSQVADPQFQDPDSGDFTLQAGSPAHGLGIEAIDTNLIGLYGEPGWENLPQEFEVLRGPQDLPPFAHAYPDARNENGDIVDDFEAGYNLYFSQMNASLTVGPLTPYISLTLDPDPGLKVDVSTLSFAARSLVDPEVPGGAGPTQYELRSSADGFTTPLAAGSFETSPGENNYWYYLVHGSLNEQAIPDVPLEIRLYLLGASGTSRAGTFRIDDLSLSGRASPQAKAETLSYSFEMGSLDPTSNNLVAISPSPLTLVNVGTNGFSRVNPADGYLNASGEVYLADLEVTGRYASGGRSASGNVMFTSARSVSGQRSLRMEGESRFVYDNRAPLTINPLVDGGPAESEFFLYYENGQSTLEARWVDERGREGPKLQLNGNSGQLSVNGQVLTTISEGTWIQLTMQASVGVDNSGTWTLTAAISGEAPLVFSSLTFSTNFHEWQNMEWNVVNTSASNPAVFYLDDVNCR